MAQLAASLLARLLGRLETGAAWSSALVRMDVTQHSKQAGTQAWCRPNGGGMENGGFPADRGDEAWLGAGIASFECS
jgi:hypothetical protein